VLIKQRAQKKKRKKRLATSCPTSFFFFFAHNLQKVYNNSVEECGCVYFLFQFFVEGFEAKLIPETMSGMNSHLLGEKVKQGWFILYRVQFA